MKEVIAIVYQATTPPARNGIIKPMKPGGYADSGADIACSLKQQHKTVITPTDIPDIEKDLDWVFPDTREGIQLAIDKGVNIIWLNTVLYEQHPIVEFLDRGIAVVGQDPATVDKYDDKWITNELLRAHQLPIPDSTLITSENIDNDLSHFSFPVIAKPIRGRGSQGVSFAKSERELTFILKEMLNSRQYGEALYVEEFLPGQEVTITVMPPGRYRIKGQNAIKEKYWSLPPVRRFNHENGIAPYNGIVAVVNNSEVLSAEERETDAIRQLCRECELSAQLVEGRSPIRIDCRANAEGKYFLFDLNLKPNMTGASRPHRRDQDSLTALAAREIGWSFDDLVLNTLNQHWRR